MATVTFQPAAAVGSDTQIANRALADTNYGTDNSMDVGRIGGPVTFYRSLIAFDISAVPGPTVLTAMLTLQCGSGASSAIASVCRRITATWSEGSVTWNNRSTNPDVAWTNKGGDFVTDDQVTFNLPTAVEELSLDVTALAQDAITNRNGELNLILMTTGFGDASAAFATSDHATESLRPKLTVTTPVYGPFDVQAKDIFIPGALAGEVFTPGAVIAEVDS